jgi:membrane protein YqaA with SNARE-associated domain
MVYLWIMLIVIPSPILIFISSETIAIVWALKGSQPVLIAGALAVGQTIGFTLICYFGDQLRERWERMNKMLDGVDIERYRRYAPRIIAWTAFVGIPPVNVSCLAAGAVRAPILLLIPIIFFGRFARYWIVASLPNVFSDYINIDRLPQWLIDL